MLGVNGSWLQPSIPTGRPRLSLKVYPNGGVKTPLHPRVPFDVRAAPARCTPSASVSSGGGGSCSVGVHAGAMSCCGLRQFQPRTESWRGSPGTPQNVTRLEMNPEISVMLGDASPSRRSRCPVRTEVSRYTGIAHDVEAEARRFADRRHQREQRHRQPSPDSRRPGRRCSPRRSRPRCRRDRSSALRCALPRNFVSGHCGNGVGLPIRPGGRLKRRSFTAAGGTVTSAVWFRRDHGRQLERVRAGLRVRRAVRVFGPQFVLFDPERGRRGVDDDRRR